MPKSTKSRRAQAIRRDPVADREAWLLALQANNGAQIEAAWPGATVTKRMLADGVVSYRGEGEYRITERGLAELAGPADSPQTPEIGPWGDYTDEPDQGQDVDRTDSHELDRDAAANEALQGLEDAGWIGEDAANDDTLIMNVQPAKTCACGCGAEVNSADHVQRLFRQGHDQRLIGMLASAAAQNREVGLNEGGMLTTGSARTYGARFLKDGGCAKLDAAIKRAGERAARPKRTAIQRAVADDRTTHGISATTEDIQRAKDAPHPAGEPSMGDEIRVRIGRHEYYARVHGMNQAGKVTAVSYRTKANPDVEKVTERFVLLTD